MSQSELSPFIRYAIPNDPFYQELRTRVNAYLRNGNHSRYAGSRMWIKTITILSLLIASGVAIYSNAFQGMPLILLLPIFQFTQFLSTIGIVHDAAHNCYSKDRKTNRRMMYLFDLLGISSERWIENHVDAHHGSPNVPDFDSAIESFSLVRLHPKTPGNRFNRHQHVYMFGIYALSTIFQVYLLEFVSFWQNLTGFRKNGPGVRKQVLLFSIQKTLVLTYSLILPLMILRSSVAIILTGWFLGHVLCGLALGVIFMTTHLHEATEFIEPDAGGWIQDSQARHILKTTADVAANSRLFTWISGGLNLHVAHHLFPTISQIHLPAMTKIVKMTAKEFNIPYHEYSLWQGILSHLRLLKRLAQLPSHPMEKNEAA